MVCVCYSSPLRFPLLSSTFLSGPASRPISSKNPPVEPQPITPLPSAVAYVIQDPTEQLVFCDLVNSPIQWSPGVGVHKNHQAGFEQIAGLHSQGFKFSRSGMGPKNFRFWHILRWSCCCLGTTAWGQLVWRKEHSACQLFRTWARYLTSLCLRFFICNDITSKDSCKELRWCTFNA